ncbi:hypothetical protein [Fodinicola feengrottensis]|uniref:Uncharacterized protein n=1 Tax=Fodinicola feengrottensis TaxID=435914 RepID=A0ABN2GTI8_9ACTN|nr:hypothetical protein [Fodinicola feengrottensis]
MARDYDTQLLESVAVRRRRLRDALIWGRLRTRRTISDNVVRFLIGLVLAGLGCAACVGWSYLQKALADQAKQAKSATAVVRLVEHRPTQWEVR